MTSVYRLLMVTTIILFGAGYAVDAIAETDLHACLGSDNVCSDSTAIVVDTSCGRTFYVYYGRIAWNPLRNEGPVTFTVTTRALPGRTTIYPMYVEVVQRPEGSTECTTRPYSAGRVVIAAYGADQCGGTQERIGPLRLETLGIPLGSLYQVQVLFLHFWTADFPTRRHSTAMSCIDVDRAVTTEVPTWSNIKHLYR